jgi:hypothetical protein
VCFIRNLFPSDCFKETTVGGTLMRCLRPREVDAEGNPGAVVSEEVLALTTMLETAFEALEKGYLRGIVLGVYNVAGGEKTLAESYVFSIKYPAAESGEGPVGTLEVQRGAAGAQEAFTMPRLKDAAVQMIRSLIRLCETMEPVAREGDRALCLRLFFTPDTPADYQPGAGEFTDAAEERGDFYGGAFSAQGVGKVATRSLSLSIKAAWADAAGAEEEGEAEAAGLAAPAPAPAPPVALPAPPAPPVPLAAPPGVDAGVLAAATQLASGFTVLTLKTLRDALAARSLAGGAPVDVSTEQARALLRALEDSGVVRAAAGGGGKFDVVAGGAAAAAAAARAQRLLREATLLVAARAARGDKALQKVDVERSLTPAAGEGGLDRAEVAAVVGWLTGAGGLLAAGGGRGGLAITLPAGDAARVGAAAAEALGRAGDAIPEWAAPLLMLPAPASASAPAPSPSPAPAPALAPAPRKALAPLAQASAGKGGKVTFAASAAGGGAASLPQPAAPASSPAAGPPASQKRLRSAGGGPAAAATAAAAATVAGAEEALRSGKRGKRAAAPPTAPAAPPPAPAPPSTGGAPPTWGTSKRSLWQPASGAEGGGKPLPQAGCWLAAASQGVDAGW